MPKQSDSEVFASVRRFWWGVALCFFIAMAAIAVYAIYMDRRLNAFQDALRFRAPIDEELGEDADIDLLMVHPVQGQTVYVPAYSHVYHQDGEPHLLTVTLSVRNTSTENPILLTSVRYFDTDGKEVKSFLENPVRLRPLAAREFLIGRADTSGGSGANFLVEWVAEHPVTEPILEAVMIDTSGQQGISFVRSGKVVKERTSEDLGEKETNASAPVEPSDGSP